ncbi:MAG: CaiB/BaiF CoA transferase family protein, partial [Burkholderiales bacterium]
GPYRERPGFGTVAETGSGYAYINGWPETPPTSPPFGFADSIAGISAAMGTAMALFRRERTGEGDHVDVALYEPLMFIIGDMLINYTATGFIQGRVGNGTGSASPRGVYVAADGKWLSIAASNQGIAKRLFAAIGRPELIDDPRYSTNAARVQHANDLDAIIGAFVRERTQAANVAFFEKEEVTIGPIYDISQIVEDPQVVERELLADYPDAEMDAFPMHHVVPRLSATPGSIRTPAPHLGEHNRLLLAELGISDAAYADLRADGIVCEGESHVKIEEQ